MRAESLEDLEDGSCARREHDASMLLPSTQVGRWARISWGLGMWTLGVYGTGGLTAGFLWQVSWLCPRLGDVAPLETSALPRGDLGVHGAAQCCLGGQSVAPPS